MSTIKDIGAACALAALILGAGSLASGPDEADLEAMTAADVRDATQAATESERVASSASQMCQAHRADDSRTAVQTVGGDWVCRGKR